MPIWLTASAVVMTSGLPSSMNTDATISRPSPKAATASTRRRLRTTPGSPKEPRTSNHPAVALPPNQ